MKQLGNDANSASIAQQLANSVYSTIRPVLIPMVIVQAKFAYRSQRSKCRQYGMELGDVLQQCFEHCWETVLGDFTKYVVVETVSLENGAEATMKPNTIELAKLVALYRTPLGIALIPSGETMAIHAAIVAGGRIPDSEFGKLMIRERERIATIRALTLRRKVKWEKRKNGNERNSSIAG
jgi:hypothetical protein